MQQIGHRRGRGGGELLEDGHPLRRPRPPDRLGGPRRQRADQDHLIDRHPPVEIDHAAADLPVKLGGRLAQLEHVTEHDHSTRRVGGKLREGPKGRDHRVGVGVVGIVVNHGFADPLGRHPHLERRRPGQRLVDPSVGHPQVAGHGHRGERVERVVLPRQTEREPTLPVDLEPPPRFVAAPAGQPKIGIGRLAEAHDRLVCRQVTPQGRRVGGHHRGSRGSAMGKQRRLLPRHALNRAEAREVRPTDGGDHRDIRLDDPAQAIGLARRAAAHLDDHVAVAGIGAEDRQRHADLVVVRPWRGAPGQDDGEHRVDQALGRGLARGSGDGDDRGLRQGAPVGPGHPAEGPARVVDEQNAHPAREPPGRGLTLHHHQGSARPHGFGQVGVAVVALAPDGDEGLAPQVAAGVDSNAAHRDGGARRLQPPAAADGSKVLGFEEAHHTAASTRLPPE